MGTPPPKLSLSLDDLPGAPDWVGPLLARINAFSGPVSEALTNGLGFADNFAGQVVTVSVTPPDDWMPVVLGNGWQVFPGAPQFGKNTAVRCMETGEVVVRGLVNRSSNPATGSTIFAIPTGYQPGADGDRRVLVEAGGAPGGVEVKGSNVNYLFGNAGLMDLGSIRWRAVAPPLRWPKALSVALGRPGTPFPGTPGLVIPVWVEPQKTSAARVVATGVDWSVEPNRRDGVTAIRVHRINGLLPLVSYQVTLLVLAE